MGMILIIDIFPENSNINAYLILLSFQNNNHFDIYYKLEFKFLILFIIYMIYN